MSPNLASPAPISELRDPLVELCQQLRVDPWHARNSLRRPLYQEITCDVIRRIAGHDDPIVEIGCGVGDILIELAKSDLDNLYGLESDPAVFQVAEGRTKALRLNHITLLNVTYPTHLQIHPSVLLLINCMYFDAVQSKADFGAELLRWMIFNGEPEAFLVETVDESYSSLIHTRFMGYPTEFNPHCRVSPMDMKCFFKGYQLYQVPSSEPDRVPKTIYLVSRQNYDTLLEGAMTSL